MTTKVPDIVYNTRRVKSKRWSWHWLKLKRERRNSSLRYGLYMHVQQDICIHIFYACIVHPWTALVDTVLKSGSRYIQCVTEGLKALGLEPGFGADGDRSAPLRSIRCQWGWLTLLRLLATNRWLRLTLLTLSEAVLKLSGFGGHMPPKPIAHPKNCCSSSANLRWNAFEFPF